MNDKTQTLVILTPGFPANEQDVNCLPMLQAFVRTVRKVYPELKIIIMTFDYPYFKKRYEWFGVDVFSFGGRNKGGLQKLLLWNRIRKTLKELHSTHEIIGLLSIWLNTCAYVGNKFAGKEKIKHFCWIMGQDARAGNKYVARIKPGSDELIALSDFLQEEMERNYHLRPKHVIPAILDRGLFGESAKERDIDLLAAGSFIPLKQYHVFIEIVSGIKKQIPSIKAVLAGAGPEENKLRDLAREYGLESKIKFTGEAQHPELLQLMQRAKVFLHPSSYEGFSGVCLEALYAGAHVISFCRAMKNEIDHWHIVNSKEEMQKKAFKILQNPETEYRSVLVFQEEDTVRRMMNLYGY